MNLIEFTKILHNPNLLKKEDAESLENILQEYPFFQAARVLHLSALKKQSSFKYNTALKKTAAFTTDRSILFDFITTDDFVMENYISKKEKPEKESEPVPAKPKSDKKAERKEEVQETRTEETQEKPQTETGKKESKETLPVGKPISFKKEDSFSFNEWLNLTGMTPVREERSVKKPAENPQEKKDLIDKFITDKPKIRPSGSSDVTDYSEYGTVENEHLMTETLAHVYLEQKKYSKAITAFRILSLKYPEKSSFFANQIEEIEKLQKNKS